MSYDDSKDDTLKFKVQLNCKSLTVTYKHEEMSFETILTFPTDYPLSPIIVDVATNKIGVSEAQEYSWKRMLILSLLTKDISVVETCILWKKQLDRQFDNSDACPICYSVFYLRTTTIPNVYCKCCRNKFHKQCIFGWFKSTGRSDCPLCTKNFFGQKK